MVHVTKELQTGKLDIRQSGRTFVFYMGYKNVRHHASLGYDDELRL